MLSKKSLVQVNDIIDLDPTDIILVSCKINLDLVGMYIT